MNAVLADALLAKYDVPAPRYTSYPTVPYWETTPSEAQWLEHVDAALRAGAPHGAALYLHMPFCRALCTFCGCNTRITRSHSFVPPYSQALLAELDLYLTRLGLSEIEFGELHFGGGTPTFLTTEELEALLAALFRRVRARPMASASIEVDPRVTSREQLQLLARYGFRRISLGVQDFDPRVQDIVNRVQSEQQVREITDSARELGFDSVNFDLIYGLPLQTRASVETTMDAVCRLRPDRIAFYGYAHVPWIKPGQRRFTEADLPQGADKRALYELGRERLEREGYREVGLDHFALLSDGLWQALRRGTLHRNFMGYATAFTLPLIGLGVSAIGDAGDAFAQNEKDLQRYQERVSRGELPIQRGHLLDAEDRVLRAHILRLMTRLATRWDSPAERTPWLQAAIERLAEPAADGLVELDAGGCRVTELGRPFLRNICMAFDARLARRMPDKALFSRTV
ncbi:MAG TPA: oxygen-independent coproporphyrinogen III oxidase [Steroidobacteraceae bacterium]|jgi:oxygen-independent coproporphyrinogen-3 oxidase|nr:oxygen-independent coproporphyrinogen III oxidase [Steroidobacteraceae bacterium]